MVRTLHEAQEGKFTWIDVVDPDKAELEAVARAYKLHPNSVEDCLEPTHLPKYERIRDVVFVILRAHDEEHVGECESVQQLTRKLAIFIGQGFIITIHRANMAFFTRFNERWKEGLRPEDEHPYAVLLALMGHVSESYEMPLAEGERIMDRYEYTVFNDPRTPFDFREFYNYKRKIALIKKMLRMTLEVQQKIDVRELATLPDSGPRMQDLKEWIEENFFQAEELINDGNNLMNMYLNISSHRNNEVVRVLTLFSAIFLPLAFIAGIYGMNFEIMPELKWRYGYVWAWGLMAAVAGGILFWFRKNKWI